MVGWVVGGLVIAIGLWLMWIGETAPPPLTRGDSAPGFDLPLLSGAQRVSLADYSGRVVLVNFWATWCKPCEDEIPAMERLYRSLHGEGFELIAVSVDEDESAVESFRERLQISFPIAIDPRQEIARRYQTMGFPESFLIDRDGRLVERYIGPREWDHRDYVERIRSLMSAS